MVVQTINLSNRETPSVPLELHIFTQQPFSTDGRFLGQMVKILQEFKLEISAILLVLAIFLMIIVITANFFPNESPDLLKRVHDDVGSWIVWLDVLAPILLLVSGYYFGATLIMSREFEKLIDTNSRAVFSRNQDRLEELAFNLTENHRKRLQEKKDELKIRK